MDLLLQGTVCAAIITFMGLVIGRATHYFGLALMWDYSNMSFNYDGVICLPFSLIWIGLSIVGVLLIDAINYYVFEEAPVPYYKVFGKTIFRYKEKQCKLH